MNYEAFYKITYGLFVISSGDKKRPNGYVANTAFQVTAEPAQLAISCNKNNFTSELIQQTGRFSISVLNESASAKIIRDFGYESGVSVEKFTTDVKYTFGEEGTPILLSDCCAWFDCKVTQEFDVGTHILFIGEVIANDMIDETAHPMTYAYYRKVKRGKAPKNAPTYIDKSKLEANKETKVETKGAAQCLVCKFKYDPAVGDPDGGIPAGTPFEDIPDDWVCPVCGATKDMFEEI